VLDTAAIQVLAIRAVLPIRQTSHVLDGSRARVQKNTKRSTEASQESIEVVAVDGHHGLVATKDFAIGDHILVVDGEIASAPSRFSVQIGPDLHVEVPAEVKINKSLDCYRWRFLNHSCEPNAEFVERDLVALREIKASEQITFDYNTTEYDLASPFECQCGSDRCCGVVRGYRWQQGQARAEG